MEKIYGFVPMSVRPGKTSDFIAAAHACHEAASTDLTGTSAYEWFVNEDGTKAYVIEIYDDPAAIALHGKLLGGRLDAVRASAEMEIMFGGDVPQPLKDRMRDRIGAVGEAGRLAFGRITNPAPHRDPPEGAERICAVAWFQPHAGKAAGFRELARQSYDMACERDPGTLGYEWFFDADGNCVALDIYRDPDAMVAHMGNCGDLMQQMLQLADSRTILFGALPDAIESRLRPELNITRFPRRLHGVCD